jgi:hypothetical protein
MSAVIVLMSNRGDQFQSARAALSSSERGQESAIACRTGSTRYSMAKAGMCRRIASASSAGVKFIAATL